MNKNILMPVSFLMLLAMDIMAIDAINSDNEGLFFYGWLAILASVIIYAIIAIDYLSGKKKS